MSSPGPPPHDAVPVTSSHSRSEARGQAGPRRRPTTAPTSSAAGSGRQAGQAELAARSALGAARARLGRLARRRLGGRRLGLAAVRPGRSAGLRRAPGRDGGAGGRSRGGPGCAGAAAAGPRAPSPGSRSGRARARRGSGPVPACVGLGTAAAGSSGGDSSAWSRRFLRPKPKDGQLQRGPSSAGSLSAMRRSVPRRAGPPGVRRRGHPTAPERPMSTIARSPAGAGTHARPDPLRGFGPGMS